MSRIQQQHPGNYRGSAQIDGDISNIIRYLNAAELGNKTLAELLRQLFDDNGVFDGPVEFRWDASKGVEYRIGEYSDQTAGWKLLISRDDTRGLPGSNLGDLRAPALFDRQDFTATAGQTIFGYATAADAGSIMVFRNGVLLAEADYSWTPGASVTLVSAATAGDALVFYSIRDDNAVDYSRTDGVITSANAGAAFTFVHSSDDLLLVARNGIMQTEGATNDFISQPSSNTLQFNSPLVAGEAVSALRIGKTGVSSVTGLMTEAGYTDGSGAIPWSKIAAPDGSVPQAKVNGLVAALADKKNLFVSGTAPSGAVAGDQWMDTSQTPVVLKIFDGTSWVAVSPDASLPAYTSADANKYLRVNGTGSGLAFSDPDFSSLLAKNQLGAANGVASLNSQGVLPSGQLPQIFAPRVIWREIPGTLSAISYFMGFAYRETLVIDGICGYLGAGTASVRLHIDGNAYGPANNNLTTTLQKFDFASSVEVDATSTPAEIEIKLNNVSVASDLKIGISVGSASS